MEETKPMFVIDLRNKLVSEYRFSIMNNNKVDSVWLFSHFKQYASYNVYLKVIGSDEKFAKKIKINANDISIEDNALLVKFQLTEEETKHQQIFIQLLFEEEGGDEVAQDREVSITLNKSLPLNTKLIHEGGCI